MKLHDPWPYYQIIEDDVSSISKTILFHPDNGQTYGDKIAEMIICLGSEIDTNLKMLTETKSGDILNWIKELNKRHPGLENIKLKIQNSEVRVAPFIDISSIPVKSPKWWREYNKVKHNRYENRKLATLLNLLESTGGLFVINSLIGLKIGRLRPITQSIIFSNPSALLVSYSAFSGIPDTDTDEKHFGYHHRYGSTAT